MNLEEVVELGRSVLERDEAEEEEDGEADSKKEVVALGIVDAKEGGSEKEKDGDESFLFPS